MNILSKLPKIVGKKSKRKGRGLSSRRGAKSGRGTTRHQKARTKIPLHFEGGQGRMVKKYPLLRGKGRNKPVTPKPEIVKLSDLEVFKNGEVVNIDKLVEHKIVDVRAYKVGVKLLASGELKKKLTISIPASKNAKRVIESLGGTAQ